MLSISYHLPSRAHDKSIENGFWHNSLFSFSFRFFGQIFLNDQLGDDKKRDVHRSAEGKGATDHLINQLFIYLCKKGGKDE